MFVQNNPCSQCLSRRVLKKRVHKSQMEAVPTAFKSVSKKQKCIQISKQSYCIAFSSNTKYSPWFTELCLCIAFSSNTPNTCHDLLNGYCPAFSSNTPNTCQDLLNGYCTAFTKFHLTCQIHARIYWTVSALPLLNSIWHAKYMSGFTERLLHCLY